MTFLQELLAPRQPWQLLNILGFGFNACLTYTVGANEKRARKLGFENNKLVSDAYPTLVTPAGFAFAIWGPIFSLETAFCLWQFTKGVAKTTQEINDLLIVNGMHNQQPALQAMSPYWVGSCVLQGLWGLAFGKRMTGLATTLIAGIAICLNQCYTLTQTNSAELDYKIISVLPFSMHSTWVVIASLVNFNIFLKQKGFGKAVTHPAAYATIFTAFLFPLYCTVTYQDPVPALVSAWALFAVSKKPKDPVELGYKPSEILQFNKYSKTLSVVGLGVGLVMLLGNWFRG